jgi:large subunit ribosomal protein L3e
MAHRKFEAPRHGSLGFLPRKRCRRGKGKIKSFPVDNFFQECHLTASIGYKAGMTHVVREVDKPGSKLHKKDIVEAVTVLETPPLKIAGFVGYIETPKGLKSFKTVWADNLPEEFLRNYYKNWYKSKKKAFSKYFALRKNFQLFFNKDCDQIKKFSKVIRCICYSVIKKSGMKQKKAKIFEIQVNGGSISDKISFCLKLIGNEVAIDDIFKKNESIDVIGITKGKGFEGVVTRWGVTKLPRKTHRGARKVACIGSWHPARVSFTVPRAGQNGYHHRTQTNLKIYKIGKSTDNFNGSTEYDLSEKKITPMGGFPYYGIVKSDFIMLKGCVMGPKKRLITLRKKLYLKDKKTNQTNIVLKFIDTSSKWGHGRFQTSDEKKQNFLTN